jgi:hypothetical protein
MNYYLMVCISLLLLGTSPVHADMASPQSSFGRIIQCVKKEDTHGCRQLLTASSVSLYDRFVSYDLMRCLPKNASYISHQKSNGAVILRASATVGGNKRYMRLMLSEEEGQWKLDVPESLRLGMGENWEKQIQMTEQLYLVMKQQMGVQLTCEMAENLARANRP